MLPITEMMSFTKDKGFINDSAKHVKIGEQVSNASSKMKFRVF
jgi:hypothetical protein